MLGLLSFVSTVRDNPTLSDPRHDALSEDPPTAAREEEKPPVESTGRERVRWWLWPHLASLDAPLVAVVWQEWWARGTGIHLPWQRDVILGLAVWLIYLADRFADVTRAPVEEHRTSRHVFYHRAGTSPAALALAVTLGLAILTPWWLTRREFGGGLALLGLAGAYFWTTHRPGGASWTVVLPKEGAVGGLFALGSALFAWCRVESMPAACWAALAGFAGLCFLNCALITRWEAGPRDLRDPASLLNAFPALVRWLPTGCAALTMTAGGLSWIWSGVFLPVAVSAGLLWGLDRCRARLSVDALRVLADMALLTPTVFLWLVNWPA